MYLYNKLKNKSKAHFWKDGDTSCMMWSRGGIKRNRKGWELFLTEGDREICHMCKQNNSQTNSGENMNNLEKPVSDAQSALGSSGRKGT